MAPSHLKVIGVMSRGNLYHAGSEFLIHISVGNYGYLPANQGQYHRLSDDILITFILRIHGQRRIAQHGFRTCGSYLHKAIAVLDGIVNMPEMACLLLVQYFCVGDRCLTYGAPVDNPGAFVDITLLIKTDKYLKHSLRATLVHGKTLPIPVAGGAQLLKLIYNSSAVFLLPLPGSL